MKCTICLFLVVVVLAFAVTRDGGASDRAAQNGVTGIDPPSAETKVSLSEREWQRLLGLAHEIESGDLRHTEDFIKLVQKNNTGPICIKVSPRALTLLRQSYRKSVTIGALCGVRASMNKTSAKHLQYAIDIWNFSPEKLGMSQGEVRLTRALSGLPRPGIATPEDIAAAKP